MIIASRRETLGGQTNPVSSSNTPSPVDADGNINFDLLFAQAELHPDGFTADQAAKVITSVEKSIPAVISDREERNELLRKMLLATMTGPASAERLAYDAHQRQEALAQFKRNRINLTADLVQKTSDSIKDLESQIAAKHAVIDNANKQLAAITDACDQQQENYTRVIDLFSDPSAKQ
jgi:hypothetical protein